MKFLFILFFLSVIISPLFASHQKRMDKLNDFFSKKKTDILPGDSAIDDFNALQEAISQMDELFLKENETTLNMTKLEFLENKANIKKFIASNDKTNKMFDDYQKQEEAAKKLDDQKNNHTPPTDANFIDTRHLFEETETDEDLQRKAEIEETTAKACTEGFVAAVPPSFCYKTNKDDGKDAYCSSGYSPRTIVFVDICVQNCRAGYSNGKVIASNCYQNCRPGFSDLLLSCFKNIFNWYFKSSYSVDTYTLYDSRAICDWGFYKSAKYCYRDCAQKSMLNCRTDICTISSQACTDGLKNIAKDFFLGLGKFFLNIFTFGISGFIINNYKRSQMTDAVNKAGKAAMLVAYNNVKSWLARISRDTLISQMTTFALGSLKPEDLALTNSANVKNRCGSVRDIFYENIINTSEPNFEWSNFQFTNIKDAVKKCSEAGQEFLCAKLVKETRNKWDGSGIATFVSAFNQEKCQV